ncbi:MAG: DUF420 domain-containing protein [Elusimicrobia bacterium]|nr:DUF420 domain-containing protein [Elusimicrobiota bacterium]
MIRLPALNALLNTASAVFLLIGLLCIRAKKIAAHRAAMGAAVLTSALFLVSYLYYHAHHGVTRFTGTGVVRFLYLSLLLTHTVLAMVAAPLVLATLALALRGRFETHRRVARWTWPVWMYVSVTGVMIYFFLYHG